MPGPLNYFWMQNASLRLKAFVYRTPCIRCLKVQDSGHNGVFIKRPLKCNSKFGLLQNKFENLQSLRFYRKKTNTVMFR